MDLPGTPCHRLPAEMGPKPASRTLAMSAMTQSGRRGLARRERLFDALGAPARGERGGVAVPLAYAAVWPFYGATARGSQDTPADMSEQFARGRERALGYPKPPPLAMAVV